MASAIVSFHPENRESTTTVSPGSFKGLDLLFTLSGFFDIENAKECVVFVAVTLAGVKVQLLSLCYHRRNSRLISLAAQG